MDLMTDFEKLGVFYLGRETDPSGTTAGAPVLYDSRHLLTHADGGGRSLDRHYGHRLGP